MIDIDEKNLKHGVLGLVIALVEIINDTLKIQATKRMEAGSLTDQEVERLGVALEDLNKAIEDMKTEQGVTEAVQNVRSGLDSVANEVINKMINPERWRDVKNAK
ncbi:MAG: gas vesicle protein K [Nanoarchaeota archaeon]|nr:gas vesicle protein K [Nanoarchaeota archaeon]